MAYNLPLNGLVAEDFRDVTDMTFGAGGLWLGICTGAGGTATIA